MFRSIEKELSMMSATMFQNYIQTRNAKAS